MGRIPDSGTLPVDIGAWLAEMVALGNRNDEGHTTKELAAALGASECAVLTRLQQARDLGRLVVGRRTITSLDGRKAQVPVYRVTAPPKKGKR
jgi:hypothetical protein